VSKNLLILFAAALVTSAIPLHFMGMELLSFEGVLWTLVLALSLIGVAFVLALIPAAIYWLFKRRRMPYLSAVVWGLWALITVVYFVDIMVFKS